MEKVDWKALYSSFIKESILYLYELLLAPKIVSRLTFSLFSKQQQWVWSRLIEGDILLTVVWFRFGDVYTILETLDNIAYGLKNHFDRPYFVNVVYFAVTTTHSLWNVCDVDLKYLTKY